MAALPAVIAPSLKAKSETGLPASGLSAAAEAAWKSLSRMASHALTTAEVVLAVVFEPPATGPAGSALSPSSTATSSGLRPSRSAAAWPITV